MPPTATVNYHVHRPYPQAFRIDAGGQPGNLISPELAATRISVRDDRHGDPELDFAADSVMFTRHVSRIRVFDGSRDWQPEYEREIETLLAAEIGTTEVIVFDHTLRIDDPDAGRKPARNVHSDYSPKGAHQRLRDLLGEDRAAEWETGHFAFVNVWRPVRHPINSAPLGFVRPASVAPEDWVTLDLIYPDRTGQILGLVRNDRHDWVYRSRMTPDEVAIFNIYDNGGRPAIAHSALELVEDETIERPRISLETRTLVRY